MISENSTILIDTFENRLVSTINEGQLVQSYNIVYPGFVINKVIFIWKNPTIKLWIKLIFNDRELICTEDQLIYVLKHGWTEAKNLLITDSFITADQSKLKLLKIENQTTQIGYSIEVEYTKGIFINGILMTSSGDFYY